MKLPNDWASGLSGQLIDHDHKSPFARYARPTNHGNLSTSNHMRMRMVRHFPALSAAMFASLLLAHPATAETVTIGIGTQDTTTNTATAGTIVRQLHLLEKYLPKDGKYANIKFELEWQNFTSGPPVTNAMMANKLQFGMMGDYPLIVNGFTF